MGFLSIRTILSVTRFTPLTVLLLLALGFLFFYGLLVSVAFLFRAFFTVSNSCPLFSDSVRWLISLLTTDWCCDGWWWDSPWRYLFVCGGFLYTVISKAAGQISCDFKESCLLTYISRVSSIRWCTLFRCPRMCWRWGFLWEQIIKMSSTYLFSQRSLQTCVFYVFEIYPVEVCYYRI